MIRALAVILVFGLLAAAPPPAHAKPIKLVTLAPDGSPWYDVIRDIAEDWKALSGGSVEVRIYAGGVAGDEPDMVRKMRIGQYHAAALTGVGLARIAPEIQALQLPMMFRSEAELEYVRDKLSSRFEAAMEDQGFVLLAWGDAGWVHFFAQAPIVHPDDLKPMKLFTWAGDTVVVEAYKDSGFKPVPLPATEIYTGLQSGLIEAFPTTPVAALSFQWFGLAPHMADVNWARLVGGVVITKKVWDKIPKDLRPQLREAARAAGRRLQKRVPELGRQAIEAMQQHGLTVHHVPPDTVTEWERAARGGYPNLIGQMVPADIVAEVERLLGDYRAENSN